MGRLFYTLKWVIGRLPGVGTSRIILVTINKKLRPFQEPELLLKLCYLLC